MKINSILYRFFGTVLFVFYCFNIQATKMLQKPDILELSNNAILCMHQDRYGDMWFGTYDGLNLFNGKNTFVYRYDPHSKNSISGNIIQKITDADADHLWVSSFIGLDRFSIKERKVVASYMQYPESRLIAADSLGNTLLVSLADFVSYYSPESGEFQDIFLPGINNSNVKALFVDKSGRFQLLTASGLLRRIVIDKDHLPLTLDFEEDIALHDHNITHAFYDEGSLFYVDVTDDLFLYDCITKKKQFIANLSEIKKAKGEISQILSWGAELYISFKNNGLVRLDTSTDHAVSVVYSGVGVFCLQKDKKQNILWLGTDGQGVRMYYNKQEMFGAIMLNQLPFPALKPVRSIHTDEYGTLWLGTKGNGLFRIGNYVQWNMNPVVREKVVHYTVQDGLSDDQIFCFSGSRYEDIFWIGTEGPGLSYYSYKEDKIYTLSQQTIQPIRRVHSICEVNDSVLWIATAGDGLLEVTIEKNNGRFFVKNIEVYTFQRGGRVCNEFHSMISDGDSILYIGSRGGYGVIKFNIKSKAFEFLPLGNTENSAIGDVLSVYLSQDSVFYFGASSGLTKKPFSDTSGHAEQFGRKNGIANDMIHGILEDDFDCLWLSTNKGLTKYNPHNDFFHNYYSDLSVTEFSDDAYWRCPYTGRLLFGGINGLVWVEPDESLPARYIPAFRFWDLEIQGELFSLTGNMDKIVFPARSSSFTISFVATDYINGNNYEYSYFLEGYSKSWVELQKNNEVSFMNLPAGKYLLHVKYKNDVYDQDATAYSIPLEILPPWYQSKLAVSAYIIFIFLFAGVTIRLIERRILRQQEEAAKRIKEEQTQKAYESKLNFFTNITHELFTPLTLIKGVSDGLYSDIGNAEETRRHLDVLQDNVNNLNELIQEILDFRKIEEVDAIRPVIKEIDVAKLVRLQTDSYLPVAQKDNIQIQLEIPDVLNWYTDKSSFKKICANLASNAFKYVNEGGLVRISVAIENMHLVLKVYNTGQGIEASEIPEIFNRYRVFEHMGENKYMQMTARSGLGLFICYSLIKSLAGDIDVVSEVNQYTEVIVRLPLLDENCKPETTSLTDEVIINDNSPAPSRKLVSQSDPEKPVILVVDDNKDIVWFISKTLSEIYEIKEAYSALDALNILSAIQPALIITDVILPQMNGLDFIQQVKKNKFTRHIPIIIVSAKISDHERAEGLNVGADAYLTKPFSSVVLSSTVNRLIANKRELKAYYYSPESAFEYSEGQLIHKDDKEFMDKMVKVIQDNIEGEHLRPELIAEEMGLNTRNLYRRVKRITSLPPSDFIKDYRFTYAAQLLVSTNLSVQEIIYKVGISNKSYFYREFLKKYQMTPKQYRIQ